MEPVAADLRVEASSVTAQPRSISASYGSVLSVLASSVTAISRGVTFSGASSYEGLVGSTTATVQNGGVTFVGSASFEALVGSTSVTAISRGVTFDDGTAAPLSSLSMLAGITATAQYAGSTNITIGTASALTGTASGIHDLIANAVPLELWDDTANGGIVQHMFACGPISGDEATWYMTVDAGTRRVTVYCTRPNKGLPTTATGSYGTGTTLTERNDVRHYDVEVARDSVMVIADRLVCVMGGRSNRVQSEALAFSSARVIAAIQNRALPPYSRENAMDDQPTWYHFDTTYLQSMRRGYAFDPGFIWTSAGGWMYSADRSSGGGEKAMSRSVHSGVETDLIDLYMRGQTSVTIDAGTYTRAQVEAAAIAQEECACNFPNWNVWNAGAHRFRDPQDRNAPVFDNANHLAGIGTTGRAQNALLLEFPSGFTHDTAHHYNGGAVAWVATRDPYFLQGFMSHCIKALAGSKQANRQNFAGYTAYNDQARGQFRTWTRLGQMYAMMPDAPPSWCAWSKAEIGQVVSDLYTQWLAFDTTIQSAPDPTSQPATPTDEQAVRVEHWLTRNFGYTDNILSENASKLPSGYAVSFTWNSATYSFDDGDYVIGQSPWFADFGAMESSCMVLWGFSDYKLPLRRFMQYLADMCQYIGGFRAFQVHGNVPDTALSGVRLDNSQVPAWPQPFSNKSEFASFSIAFAEANAAANPSTRALWATRQYSSSGFNIYRWGAWQATEMALDAGRLSLSDLPANYSTARTAYLADVAGSASLAPGLTWRLYGYTSTIQPA